MTYVGDFALAATVRHSWNTNAAAGQSITRATNGTISVYKDGNTAQSTAGVTDTEDFDSLTGVHLVAIDTSADGTFYSSGSDFHVVLSAATIDGLTINAFLFSFSINNRSALRPTTAGRTLDVSAGGEAGVDWGNVGSPTTVVGLSGTTVKTATDVETDTQDLQNRTPAALVGGRMDANVGAISGDATAADNLEAATDGTGYNVGNGSVVAASVTGSIGSVGTNGINAASLDPDVATELQNGLATAATLALVKTKTDLIPTDPAETSDIPSAATIAAQVRTELTTELGRVDVAVSTRASQASVDTVDDFLDTEVAAILTAVTNVLAAVDTEVAAILADTNELQVDWTNGGRLDLLVDAILARLPTALVGGRMDSSTGAMATDVVTSAALSSGAVDEIRDGSIGDAAGTSGLAAMRLLISGMVGLVSGAATDTASFRDIADTKDVIIATVDEFGNRSAVVLDP